MSVHAAEEAPSGGDDVIRSREGVCGEHFFDVYCSNVADNVDASDAGTFTSLKVIPEVELKDVSGGRSFQESWVAARALLHCCGGRS